MKNRIGILMIILIFGTCGLFYMNKSSDDMDVAFTVKNNTKEKIETVGIAAGEKIVLNKTNGEYFCFPKEIVKNDKNIVVFAVLSDGEIAKSGEVSVKDGQEILIRTIEENHLSLDVDTKKQDIKIDIPKLDKWKVETNKNYINGQYRADTDMTYRLFLLGKGGKLGISDEGKKDVVVNASWEKPKEKVISWLVFTK